MLKSGLVSSIRIASRLEIQTFDADMDRDDCCSGDVAHFDSAKLSIVVTEVSRKTAAD